MSTVGERRELPALEPADKTQPLLLSNTHFVFVSPEPRLQLPVVHGLESWLKEQHSRFQFVMSI